MQIEHSDIKLDKHGIPINLKVNLINDKAKYSLIVEAPTNTYKRNLLKHKKIEVVESELFHSNQESIGARYNAIEDIPTLLRLKISDYQKVYLFKENLAVGDRDKLKFMFGQSKIIELEDIGVIK